MPPVIKFVLNILLKNYMLQTMEIFFQLFFFTFRPVHTRYITLLEPIPFCTHIFFLRTFNHKLKNDLRFENTRIEQFTLCKRSLAVIPAVWKLQTQNKYLYKKNRHMTV